MAFFDHIKAVLLDKYGSMNGDEFLNLMKKVLVEKYGIMGAVSHLQHVTSGNVRFLSNTVIQTLVLDETFTLQQAVLFDAGKTYPLELHVEDFLWAKSLGKITSAQLCELSAFQILAYGSQWKQEQAGILPEHCTLYPYLKPPLRFQPVMPFSDISDEEVSELFKKEELVEQLKNQRERISAFIP